MKEEKLHSHRELPQIAGLMAFAFILRLWKFYIDPAPAESLFTYWLSVAIGLAAVFVIYEISLKITENNTSALFSAALAATIPLYSWRTVAQFTHTTSVLLFFLSILVLLYMKDIGDWKPALLAPLILAFVHAYALLFIPILAIYMIFVKLERKELSRNEVYFALVSSISIFAIFFFFTSTQALFLLVQQYIKTNYYSLAVENFGITKTFAIAGLVPTYLGAFGLYLGLKEKKKSVLLLTSTLAVLLLLMGFNVIALRLGLPYFSLTLAALAGFFWKEIDKIAETTKLKPYRVLIAVVAFLIVLLAGAVHLLF